MAFIRKKTIRKPSGKEYSYFYLVSNSRQKGKVRQKVERYLGKTRSQNNF